MGLVTRKVGPGSEPGTGRLGRRWERKALVSHEWWFGKEMLGNLYRKNIHTLHFHGRVPATRLALTAVSWAKQHKDTKQKLSESLPSIQAHRGEQKKTNKRDKNTIAFD